MRLDGWWYVRRRCICSINGKVWLCSTLCDRCSREANRREKTPNHLYKLNGECVWQLILFLLLSIPMDGWMGGDIQWIIIIECEKCGWVFFRLFEYHTLIASPYFLIIWFHSWALTHEDARQQRMTKEFEMNTVQYSWRYHKQVNGCLCRIVDLLNAGIRFFGRKVLCIVGLRGRNH